MKKILIIENNEDFCYVLRWHFEQKDFKVITTNTGLSAIELYKNQLPDFILLDINLDDDMNGKDVAKFIRERDKITPIIFMSGESKSPTDVVEGFKIGCNFFLKKPVSIEEIEAHINALDNKRIKQKIFKFSETIFNTEERTIFFDNKKLYLSEKENAVLELLALYLSETVDLYEILEKVWGDTSKDESLRNIISSLRKKLIGKGFHISTIKNKGYVLDVNN